MVTSVVSANHSDPLTTKDKLCHLISQLMKRRGFLNYVVRGWMWYIDTERVVDKIQRWEKPRFLASIQLQKLILFQSSPNKYSLYRLCIEISRFFYVETFNLAAYSLSGKPVISIKSFSYNSTTATISRPTFCDFHNPGFCFYSRRSFRWSHQLLAQLVKWRVVNNHGTLFQQLFETYFPLWNLEIKLELLGAEIESQEQDKI